MIHAGIAAGPTREAAERSALEELIERDAMTVWWLRGGPAIGVRLASHPAIPGLLASPRHSGIRYHLTWVPTPFAVPVVGALLEDRDRGIVTLGTACRPQPLAAVRKALVEAVQLRAFSMQLLDRASPVWRAVDAGIHDARCYKAYRADRAYLDDFRPDFRDAIDFAGHAQLYLDTRAHVHVERILSPASTMDLTDLPAEDDNDARALYLRRLSALGFPATSVDLTTSDLRAAGLRVARVTAPGLYANAPAAFPFLGGQRLYRPFKGTSAAPLSERQLVRAPL